MPERGLTAYLDIGWEVGDLSEIVAILNSFFLPQAWVDISAMLLKAPLLSPPGMYRGGVGACALGRLGRWLRVAFNYKKMNFKKNDLHI